MTNKRAVSIIRNLISTAGVLSLVGLAFFVSCGWREKPAPVYFSKVRTILNDKEKFGEPFGIAARNGEIFVSDGETGKIWRVSDNQNYTLLTDKFHTPSAIAFDANGNLIVADPGTHTIKKLIVESGAVELIAGVENQKGFADGETGVALFNAPIGVAVSENKIFVADTYNDKIRVIENGKVLTVAGSEQGFADAESGFGAKFDTPCGLAIWKDKLIVADTGNRRVRVIEADGKTWTLAGNGAENSLDGIPYESSFVEPIAVSVDNLGVIYVADGNSIRVIGRRLFPFVETLTNTKRGFSDGNLRAARFNRPSGMASDEQGNLFVTDSENQAVRVLTGAEIGKTISPEESKKMRVSAADFRQLSEPRWTYNPPDNRREIAGTLGEIRGEITDGNSRAWFHNGLDIVGAYGETARFIRTEKVLHPIAVENFATLRELIRMPTIGYIHIRLGRDQADKIFVDNRFSFSRDEQGKVKNVRVPRGAKFEAGEAIGTLNALNHVHLIAGRTGAEMNALDALDFPGITDSIAPVIERVLLYNDNWQSLVETSKQNARIKLDGKIRIVARAYDRIDGNAERRRLGVYRVGYQVLREDETPLSDVNWTISFDRNPDAAAVKFVYANGSKSGATGETIFNYIASNRVSGDEFREDFFDAGVLESGNYILRVSAADFFGNTTSEDINFVR
jgi:sugar lactone lactonase YvrE